MGLPQMLYQRLFTKLKFEDFDIGEKVQMILDEENDVVDRMYLRAAKNIEKEEDVFLVDHAWTFKQRTSFGTLMANEKLRDRLENILKYVDKRDLPGVSPYAKVRPGLEDYLKQVEESKEPAKIYDLTGYKIGSLKTFTFKEEVEEIDLMDNFIADPNDITKVLMKLPNLRALWLNGNPVSDNCANFGVVGNLFDKLEIFNS